MKKQASGQGVTRVKTSTPKIKVGSPHAGSKGGVDARVLGKGKSKDMC